MKDNLKQRAWYTPHTSTEVEDLLATAAYAPVERPVVDRNTKGYRLSNETMTADPRLTTLFDDYIEKGVFPTQDEYVKRYYELQLTALKRLHPQLKSDNPAEYDALKKGTWNRATRAYMGYMVQYHTLLLLRENFPEAHFYTSQAFDEAGKVDIVMHYKHRYHYIHITSTSAHAKRHARRKQWLKRFMSDDTGDIYLTYDPVRRGYSAHTRFIGQYPLFKKEWLIETIEAHANSTEFGDDDSEFSTTQLKMMLDFVTRNKSITVNKVRNKLQVAC